MKASILTALAVLQVVLGNPFVFNDKRSLNPATGLNLKPRALQQMSISNCNVCTADCSEGGCAPSCDQTSYAVLGGNGQSPSCNDPSIPLNDDNCSAFGTIPTPFGNGNWVSTSRCGDTTDGTYSGCIIAPDSSWGCTCFAFAGSYNIDCGQEYSCTNTYTCECSECANNDCGTCE